MTEKCSICKKTIDWYEYPIKHIEGKPACKRCYYTQLGEFIENNPIGIVLYEQQYEAARIRLWERGISCPSKDEVNEEIDLYNSLPQQHARKVKRKFKWIDNK